MAAITLTPELETWARAEVASGRAESIEQAAHKAIAGYRLGREMFRRSLDDAEVEADRLSWISGEDFMRELDQWIVDLAEAADREAVAAKAAE